MFISPYQIYDLQIFSSILNFPKSVISILSKAQWLPNLRRIKKFNISLINCFMGVRKLEVFIFICIIM